MIYWRYTKPGPLFYAIYCFEFVDDAIPEHEHAEAEAHNVICTSGIVEILGPEYKFIVMAGEVVEIPWWKPHKIIARLPMSKTAHGYLNGRPDWYDGQPDHGTFPSPPAADSSGSKR